MFGGIVQTEGGGEIDDNFLYFVVQYRILLSKFFSNLCNPEKSRRRRKKIVQNPTRKFTIFFSFSFISSNKNFAFHPFIHSFVR